jgi:hypothetical protein
MKQLALEDERIRQKILEELLPLVNGFANSGMPEPKIKVIIDNGRDGPFLHILPIDDDREHELEDCWCDPTWHYQVETADGNYDAGVLVHHAHAHASEWEAIIARLNDDAH